MHMGSELLAWDLGRTLVALRSCAEGFQLQKKRLMLGIAEQRPWILQTSQSCTDGVPLDFLEVLGPVHILTLPRP